MIVLSAECFPRFLRQADLILPKGQANVETPYGTGRHAFFPFRCKGPVVSRAPGLPEGEPVIPDGAAPG